MEGILFYMGMRSHRWSHCCYGCIEHHAYLSRMFHQHLWEIQKYRENLRIASDLEDCSDFGKGAGEYSAIRANCGDVSNE